MCMTKRNRWRGQKRVCTHCKLLRGRLQAENPYVQAMVRPRLSCGHSQRDAQRQSNPNVNCVRLSHELRPEQEAERGGAINALQEPHGTDQAYLQGDVIDDRGRHDQEQSEEGTDAITPSRVLQSRTRVEHQGTVDTLQKGIPKEREDLQPDAISDPQKQDVETTGVLIRTLATAIISSEVLLKKGDPDKDGMVTKALLRPHAALGANELHLSSADMKDDIEKRLIEDIDQAWEEWRRTSRVLEYTMGPIRSIRDQVKEGEQPRQLTIACGPRELPIDVDIVEPMTQDDAAHSSQNE